MTRLKFVLLILSLVLLIACGIYFIFLRQSPPLNNPTPPPTFSGFGKPAESTPLLNETSSPLDFTFNFYTWYLQNLSRDQSFTSSSRFQSESEQWLTTDFASNWNNIVQSSESDPVLLTQDYQDSWASNVQVTPLSQTATSTSFLVALGTSEQLHQIRVTLIPFDNTWRIKSVATK